MKTKLSPRFWATLVLFSLIGQVAWVVENMYFNVFIYKSFNATASDISNMVMASAVSAALTTIFIGALSDKIGKRKLFMCGGYILWGISIFAFSLIRLDVIEKVFSATVSASLIGIYLVIIMDCVMTFFGSSANDAAFNAWLTDSTDSTNRGSAEGINSMMPLVAILAVFGGFMAFDLNIPSSWTMIFTVIGIVVLSVGILGLFIIKEPLFEKEKSGYLNNIVYGFLPSTVKQNSALYLSLGAFIIFNISIQIFMPYLIIYYEVSLNMKDYVLIMAPAIIVASIVTAFWGKVYDKKGFGFSLSFSLLSLSAGYVILFIFKSTFPVFIGSLLMMSGYLSGMAVFGAKIRDNTPLGKAGRLQGVRIVSQVLIPGIVGPFISKQVLKNAPQILGNDGTYSFVPTPDIFLFALIVLVFLIPFIIFMQKNKPSSYHSLKTPYLPDETPFNFHPQPQFKRDDFLILNGKWKLSVKKGNKISTLGDILVPFPPESELSGIERITKGSEELIYERSFSLDPKGKQVLLHFGAVDTEAEVFVNQKKVGEHKGGYLPFSFNITPYLENENHIKVVVRDPLCKKYAYGKQKHKRGGMWYTPISGIWQTVWVELVPENHIKEIKITPSLHSVNIKVVGGENKKVIELCGKNYEFEGDEFVLTPDEIHLWTPQNPSLYNFTLFCGEDKISSYFALREISTANVNGTNYITLNGKPQFFNALLDQGYYPDGIYTPGNEKAFIDDILKMKELGFNTLRKHIKIEPDIFYYYCDLYGMFVFQDMVNNGSYNFIIDTALPTVGVKSGLRKTASKKCAEVFLEDSIATTNALYNHPSIVYYTIFNEGWGQHNATEIYRKLKKLDSSRIWDTASGWFKDCESDVVSDHTYFKPLISTGNSVKPTIISEFGGYSLDIPGHVFNTNKVYGYKKYTDKSAFIKGIEDLYLNQVIPCIEKGVNGVVLTQLSDIEDEINGLLTYDRKILKVDKDIMVNISNTLYEVFKEKTGDTYEKIRKH